MNTLNEEGKRIAEDCARCSDAGTIDFGTVVPRRQVQYFGRHGEIHVERFPQ